jgi:hypothetical protein
MARLGVRVFAIAALGLPACDGEANPGDSRTVLAAEPIEAPSATRAIAERVLGRVGLSAAPEHPPFARADRGARSLPEGRRAVLELPSRANSPALLRDPASGVQVAFSLVGAAAVPAVKTGGVFVYAGGGPFESHLVHRPIAGGTEDYLEFAERPPEEAVRYVVDVSAVAGMRLVADVLEFLGADGTPRLRMSAPFVLDAKGTRHDAAVALLGCAADRDARGPWGRPVTPPGASSCTVRVAWDEKDVAYPAVLDPGWTTTVNTLSDARRAHTATLLANGRVLVVGGEAGTTASPTYLKTAELFDPSSNTFSPTSPMTTARSFHVAVRLANGNVLVAGGNGTSGVLPSSEVYDAGTGLFHSTGALVQKREKAQAALLGTNEVLLTGGVDTDALDAAELFDPTSEQWTATDRMQYKRVGHYLAPEPNGVPLVVGGSTSTTIGDLLACELYENSVWSTNPALNMSQARDGFGAATFSNGKVLVAGGYQHGVNATLATAELFDGASWSPAGSLAGPRTLHTLTALPSGGAVAAGGVTLDATGSVASRLDTAEVYDPTSNAWFALPKLEAARSLHTATLLQDGRVLLVGGQGATAPEASAETLSLDGNGAPCNVSTTCASGHCVDGVCCESACSGTCEACARASTGQADGTCAPVLAGKDPHRDCADDGSPACGKNGTCDGASACASYTGAPCTPNPCTEDADCTSGHCADGICCDTACSGTCEACTAAKKGSGVDGTCGPVADGTDPDAECGAIGTASCAGNGVCDGANACRSPRKGTACAPATCVDAVTSSAAAVCGALGDCTPAETSCSPYTCDAASAACKTTCTTAADCAPGGRCEGGACKLKDFGAPCQGDAECTSGHCADGLCCDQACSGQCEACDVSGSEGKCIGVTGTPRGARSACNGTPPCQGRCNGLLRTACAYPDTTTSCGPDATCADGGVTASTCNGEGLCVSGTTATCAPYACGAAACKTKCASNTDCAPGNRCDATGACVSDTGPWCSSEDHVTSADGSETSCGPYRCRGGTCGTACDTDDDCARGAKCDVEKHECAGAPAKDGGGCGCRAARTAQAQAQDAATGLAAAALGLALRRGRKRRTLGRSARHAEGRSVR